MGNTCNVLQALEENIGFIIYYPFLHITDPVNKIPYIQE